MYGTWISTQQREITSIGNLHETRANLKLLILSCLWKIRADFHRNLYFGLLTDAILSIFGSYEAMRYDSKSHPTDCYSNFSYILSLVDGASDIHNFSVVRWGNTHALVLTKAIPEVWASVNIADGDAAGLEEFSANVYGGTGGCVTDRAAMRATVTEAVIVTHKRSILGLRVGNVTYPLRAHVNFSTAGTPTTHALNIYTSMDLLAFCAWLGMDGQAGQLPFLPLLYPRRKRCPGV